MSHSFVADGYSRARSAVEPEIRAAVAAEFAERLASASHRQRVRLWLVIEREIRRRVARIAPPAALF